MCGSMNDVLGLGKLEKFSTCWSHAGAHWFSGLSGPEGLLEQGRIAGGDCKTVHARAPDAQPVTCIISENPPTSGLALLKSWRSSILGTTWSCAAWWSVVDEPSLGQRTKKVGMWGERVCPGPPGTGCFDTHLSRVGVSAVTAHQGHARSASHWQARSTDLKLSQTYPPRARQMWRVQCASLSAGGLASRGPQASLWFWAGVQNSDTRQR